MCGNKPLTRDEADATLAMIKGRRNNRKTDKKPCRKYFCKECDQWHLTSIPEKDFYHPKNRK